MKLLSFVLLLFLVLFLGGCGDPTIDASSPENLRRSLQTTMQSLPSLQQEQFRQDVIVLARGKSPDPDLSIRDYIAGRDNPEQAKPLVLRHFYNGLHGKTAELVLAEAVQVRMAQEQKLKEEEKRNQDREVEREKLLAEFSAIKERQALAARNDMKLRSIKVWQSKFSFVERPGETEEVAVIKPMIQVTIYNGTDYMFHKIYFIGSLFPSDDRQLIHKEAFTYTIGQGIAPGTQNSWTLYPDAVSGWNNVTAPEGAIFSVEVTRIDDANGEEILPGKIFSREDKAKLEQLRKRYSEQFGGSI